MILIIKSIKKSKAQLRLCFPASLLFIILLLFCEALSAQDFNNPVTLFQKNTSSLINFPGLKKPATRIIADTLICHQILLLKPEKLQLEITIDGRQLKMDLFKANVFSNDAIINALQADGSSRQLEPLSAVYYRGKVAGEPSLVALSFFKDEITGIIDMAAGNFNIGHQKNHTENQEVHYLYNSDDIAEKQSFTCFTNDDLPDLKPIRPEVANAPISPDAVGYPVDMYIETDYQNYLNLNQSTADVTKWVAGLMNITEAIYANENIKVQIKTLSIWTATDPYISATTTSDALDVFSARMASGFNGDLAHLLKYNTGQGGIAYIDILCAASNLKTGVSFIANSYLLTNDYNRAVKVVTHEIGHNLGSPHTHKCGFWSGGTGIDNCGPNAGYPEGTCTAPTLAANMGTIMSYCDQTGQPGVRFVNGFGTQPGNLIRTKVTAASCLNNCSNLTVSMAKTDATCAALGTATLTTSGGVAPVTYLWSNGVTTSSVTNLARGTYTVTVSSATAGCRVIKAVEIIESTGACPSITSFTPKNGLTGSVVNISGTNFTAATAVAFGATAAASFTINSASSITAMVGTGGNGNISVTNTSGTGAIQGFTYCNTTSRFTTPTLLGTITGNVSISGNNFASNCFTNQFTSTSIPGNANAKNGSDVFYKFTTGPCVLKLDIGVCPRVTGQDSYLWLLDSTGAVIASNDDTEPAGCISTAGSSLLAQTVMPNTTYYLVVESFNSNTDIIWDLTIKPNICNPPTITNFTPLTGMPGDSVTITGTYFTDATSMRFNGVDAASFNIISATQIGVRIPADVTMGKVSVTTGMGTAFSTANFSPNTSASGVVQICPGSAAQLTASLTGTTYKWQVYQAGSNLGFKDIVNNSNYANNNARTLNITNTPTHWYGNQYRCMVDNVASNIIQLKFLNRWTGAVNTAWENTGNWGCALKIPDNNTDIIINGGTPVINDDAFGRSLDIKSNANIILKQNKKLELGLIHLNVPLNKLYGDTETELPNSMVAAENGSVVIAGSSNSAISGTGVSIKGYDFYITRINGWGGVEWTNVIGGAKEERAYSIATTNDGGYIVAGSSQYHSSGLYNYDVVGYNQGGNDYWVVKLNKWGSIEWSKLMGGSGDDVATSIATTSDGGYIVGGYSNSSLSGAVTDTGHGNYDYWIVKLDALGEPIWNRLLGGNARDVAVSVKQNGLGEYYIAGTSESSASGDVSGIHHGGLRDYWVAKLSGNGNIIWNRLLGGTGLEEAESMCLTASGGCVITGLSGSSANGDVTATTKGSVDYWVITLNSDGSTAWNKLLGGNSNERAESIYPTSDGGFIVAGYSSSSANGDVTGTLSGAFTYDYWVVKLTAAGTLSWNKLMGGTDYDQAYAVCQQADGNYMVTGHTYSTNSGTLTGLITNGQSDIWLVKLDKLGNIIQ